MFERFAQASRDVIVRAMGEAVALEQPEIGTGEVLLALLDERAGAAATVLHTAGVTHGQVRDLVRRREPPLFDAEDAAALKAVGINLDAVVARITESFGANALGGPKRGGRLRLDRAAKDALQHALQEAVARHDRRMRPEHLLLGLLAKDCTATAVLDEAGVDRARLRADLRAALDQAA